MIFSEKVIVFLRLPYRITKTALYLLLLLLVCNVSCKKTKKCTSTISACAAFSDTFFDMWFPYSLGKEVVFLSSTGSEKKLSIRQQYKSVERSASAYEYDCDIPSPELSLLPPSGQCPNALIESTPPTDNTVGLRIAYSPSRELMLYVDTTTLYATSLQDTGIVNLEQIGSSRFNSSRFYPSYVSNGTTYNNVQVITRDTAVDHTKGIYKLVLAQKVGILEYEEYPSLLWRKK
jgi:hypothetical protein